MRLGDLGTAHGNPTATVGKGRGDSMGTVVQVARTGFPSDPDPGKEQVSSTAIVSEGR